MYDSLKITPKTRGYQIIFNHTNFHLYHYAGNNPINYTDPNGRSTTLDDWAYIKLKRNTSSTTEFTTDGKHAYKRSTFTIKIDDVDIGKLGNYALSGCVNLSIAIDKDDLVKEIAKTFELGDTFIAAATSIIEIAKLSVKCDPVTATAVWLGAMIFDYFAEADEREAQNYCATIGRFTRAMGDITGINTAIPENIPLLQPFIESFTITETTVNEEKMNLDTDTHYHHIQTKKIFTFEASVYNPKTGTYQTVKASTED